MFKITKQSIISRIQTFVTQLQTKRKERNMLDIGIGLLFVILLLSFFSEYLDSSLGGGFGTILTPVLMMFGFEPMQIVPAILISEICTGIGASYMHNKQGNVNLTRFQNGTPKDFKIASLISICSVVGSLIGVFFIFNLPKFYVKLYIGIIVFAMGVIVLATQKMILNFSWIRMTTISLIASFNKAISGGGYGPLVTSGQILSGVESKSTVGITSIAEALTCIVGLIAYMAIGKPIDYKLAVILSFGAIASVPLAGISVKKIPKDKVRLAIGILTTALGSYTLYKLF